MNSVVGLQQGSLVGGLDQDAVLYESMPITDEVLL